ncbi:hydroxymethylbilane synthase [Thermomicrobium sp. 4228-Ro]|uniref:hydroxymethylbilane synthase n=1 Tax=Thermomicrobium sp. 4228-Ro TaxID=2993937 RepID=UPI002248B3F3|nr:hydroxymethylbilane synthase [Thermomicrobium sp. 4228-Ro]MCX2727604.1 hydroxymethylbilane synthase [Thermomicrobium sp. 4228-Ro]
MRFEQIRRDRSVYEHPVQRRASGGAGGIRVGTRGSALALAQARAVVAQLERIEPTCSCSLVAVTTTGDRDRATSLTILGGSGVFVKELHEALLAGAIDLAVHSAKDLPTVLPLELEIVALPVRADVRDVLITRIASSLATLPPAARVGTSSRRRRALLAAARPDLKLLDVRGNVDTRLRKLDDGSYDALVLAAAGLERLDRLEQVTEYLDPDVFVPAPGQGALAVVCRRDDPWRDIFARIDDHEIRLAVTVERSFLAAFGSGCTVPLGAYATVEGERVRLRVAVAPNESGPVIRESAVWHRDEAVEGAGALAQELLRTLAAAAGRSWAPGAKPLTGRRVLVVRPAGQEQELVERLRRLGAEVVVEPLIAIVPPEDWREIDHTLLRLSDYDWLVFTSANGVRSVLDRMSVLGIPVEMLTRVRVATIGPATARALQEYGIEPALVPDRYVAEAVADALVAAGVAGKRVLLARAAEARDVLPRRLVEAGAEVEVVPVYRTEQRPLSESVRKELQGGTIDWVLLTASSTVRSLVAALGDTSSLHERVKFAAIGPVTASTARAYGLRVAVVATRYTSEGLVEAVVRAERSAR